MTTIQRERGSFVPALFLLFALAPVFPAPQLEAATASYEFGGPVTALPGTTGQIGDWRVRGKTIHVSATTVFPAGQPASIRLGTLVDVTGTLESDGTVTAAKILALLPPVIGSDFSGTVTVLPGTSGQIGNWTVDGKTVNVTSATVFPAGQPAAIAVGSTVDVDGILNSDGTITALRIALQGTPPSPPSAGYDLHGAVTALPGTTGQIGNWTVAGVTVVVSASTLFPAGQPASIKVGTLVDVDGTLNSDGTVTAAKIFALLPPPVMGFDFSGTVTALPGTSGQTGNWTVGGKTVNVTSSTVFPAGQPAAIAVGSTVDVFGILNADGTITALRIALQGTPPSPPSAGYDLHGAVTALPGTTGQIGNWTVAGVTVIVSASTVFPAGQPASITVGTVVNVDGTLNADGTVSASRIGAVPAPPATGHDFIGIVSALPGTTGQIGNWTVGGKTVIVSASTVFPAGQPASIQVGTVVIVTGTLNPDGTVTASKIAALPVPPVTGDDFSGTVTALPGTTGQIGNWTVGGKTVTVTASTLFPAGQPASIMVGSAVDGDGILNADGSITALRIALQGTPPVPPSGGYDLHGAVTALPETAGQIGNWTVDGVTVIVSASTLFPAAQPASIQVGTIVVVNGTLNSDGTVTASRIFAVTAPPVRGYDFSGSVTVLPGTSGQIGNWTVGGKTVTVTVSTLFPGPQLTSIMVGSMVEVAGILNPDGTITALRISLAHTAGPPFSSGYHFDGLVTSLPTGSLIGDWLVGAVTVHVTATTLLPGGMVTIAVGTAVDVRGTLQPDGSVIASAVTVDQNRGRHGRR